MLGDIYPATNDTVRKRHWRSLKKTIQAVATRPTDKKTYSFDRGEEEREKEGGGRSE